MGLLRLAKGEMAMFGYGSFLSQRCMERTLGRRCGRSPIRCTLEGWRRSWNGLMPNDRFYEPTAAGELVPRQIVYLNIRRAPDDSVNGLLYVVEAADIERFDRWEATYDRVDITPALRGVELDGAAYVYVARPDWTMTTELTRDAAAVRQSYIDIVESGLTELGGEFRSGYLRSTDELPSYLVFADRERDRPVP